MIAEWSITLLIHQVTLPAVYGLAGERAAGDSRSGFHGVHDRITRNLRIHIAERVGKKELRESRFQKQAFADVDISSREIGYHVIVSPGGERNGKQRQGENRPWADAVPCHYKHKNKRRDLSVNWQVPKRCWGHYRMPGKTSEVKKDRKPEWSGGEKQ
jgi:hypothetical protein